MAIFTKKLGQLKQWTGEKFGTTGKTKKPAEIKQLQSETRSRFEGLENIKDALKGYSKGLDDNRDSTMSLLAHAFSAHSAYHEDTDFGLLLTAFGAGLARISATQNQFSEEIRLGLLMAVESVLNEAMEFERLRAKLKNRRLDHDANFNKLQNSKGKDAQLEEKVQTTGFKYQETLKRLEDLMVGVARQEIALIDPMIEFLENQANFHQQCLEVSKATLKTLQSGKSGLKAIDYSTMSFRRELGENETAEVELILETESETEVVSDSNISSATESVDGVSKAIEYDSCQHAGPSLPSASSAATKRCVQAKYTFSGESENDLPFRKGDIITVIKEIDKGWWMGELDGKTGMLPSNYVNEMEDHDNVQKNECNSTEIENECNQVALTQAAAATATDENETKQPSQPQPMGFSYLPPGAPITFIGRKKAEAAIEDGPAVEVSAACGSCDCNDYCANVFKPGHCNNCFHKH